MAVGDAVSTKQQLVIEAMKTMTAQGKTHRGALGASQPGGTLPIVLAGDPNLRGHDAE